MRQRGAEKNASRREGGGGRKNARKGLEKAETQRRRTREESASERRVRKHLDAELLARVEDAVLLHGQLPRRVFDLDEVDGGDLCRAAERLSRALREANELGLALFAHGVERADRLLDRPVGGGARGENEVSA